MQKLASSEGGTILCGGSTPSGLSERVQQGYFFAPTVIDGLAPSSRVSQASRLLPDHACAAADMHVLLPTCM